MKLTANFSLEELTNSDYAIRHGINNQPVDPEVLSNLQVLANGLERARSKLCRPMVISSGYRSPKVNSGVGGAKNSRHMKGLAADFIVPNMAVRETCFLLETWLKYIGFRTLIFEGSWVHIDFPDLDEEADGTVLTAIFKAGHVTYVEGIV